nr:hypothetical protein B0A51_00026 [Rachicladosporium sp. CCFEE 5018]
MMNQYPAGAGQHHGQQNIPHHEQSRRQQQYNYNMQHGMPQSPMHHPYGYPPQHGHVPYYPQQGQQQYPRWQPTYQQYPYAQMPHQGMPQQIPPQQYAPQHPPRSPLVVSSQPQQVYPQHGYGNAPSVQPNMRGTPMQQSQHVQAFQPSMQAAPSPRPMPHHMASYPHTPMGLPSPAPTPPRGEPTPIVKDAAKSSPAKSMASPVLPTEVPPPAVARQEPVPTNPLSLPPVTYVPHQPKLPWYSDNTTAASFPPRSMARRRKRQDLNTSNDALALPHLNAAKTTDGQAGDEEAAERVQAEEPASETSTIAALSERETPATSQAPSESDCTQVSTPTTPAQASAPSPKPTPTQTSQHTRRDTRTAIAVPFIPGLPKSKATAAAAEKVAPPATPVSALPDTVSAEAEPVATTEESTPVQEEEVKAPAKPAAPKSWADLVRSKDTVAGASSQQNGSHSANGVAKLPQSASLSEALRQYTVANDRLSFLEPRGLVNTGNMCYMNSILQVLVFCAPFYDFLSQVQERTVHSMKSETPLVDALIMFMREFKVIGSGDSADALRKQLKPEELEKFGDPVTPEYVYDAIRSLPRFQGMRRGQQQDSEEFLGFLLEGLHDECVTVMEGQKSETSSVASPAAQTSGDGWLEVGPRQKASVTRTAGQEDVPSPITKIFGGHLRSELRVPGQKDSVVLEPYKPLQLDIGASHVNNIVDALKGLTRTENLTGDFGGRSNSAKKQVFIDTLPPVLILHLKRFQYESNLTGTVKIWKKVGYPLELEIPKEVFPPSKRGGFAVKGGLPKYRLTAVVYHHGKSAAGGHYTVDVLRQDSREWVRMDDTVIRRVRPQDVAEGGAEEDPKLLARALEQHKAEQDLQKQRNMYDGLDEETPVEEKPWNEVNGAATAAKKLAGAATTNGTATPSSTAGKRTPTTARRENVKDNKVAYILLYERMRS